MVFQPDFDDPRFSGFNPYALGFAMMQDIERIVTNPDDEDREWFPEIAGTGDVMAVLRDIWANYRDESFISQFLSPRLMRQMRMFHLHDDPDERAGVKVDAIHDERGYRRIRRELARQYDVGFIDPNIEVVDVDLAGDRRLMLRHAVVKGAQLERGGRQARAPAPGRSLGLRRGASGGRFVGRCGRGATGNPTWDSCDGLKRRASRLLPSQWLASLASGFDFPQRRGAEGIKCCDPPAWDEPGGDRNEEGLR